MTTEKKLMKAVANINGLEKFAGLLKTKVCKFMKTELYCAHRQEMVKALWEKKNLNPWYSRALGVTQY